MPDQKTNGLGSSEGYRTTDGESARGSEQDAVREDSFSKSGCDNADGGLACCRAACPRLEFIILAIGFVCNLAGKMVLVINAPGGDWVQASAIVLSADIAFFLIVTLLVCVGHAALPAGFSSRAAIVIAVPLALWSVSNLAWLMATGAQIHVGVFVFLIRDTVEVGAIVVDRLTHRLMFSIPLLVVSIAMLAVIARQLWRPTNIDRDRFRSPKLLGALVAAIILVVGSRAMWAQGRIMEPRRAALSFSSHLLAISTVLGLEGGSDATDSPGTRHVARRGERSITPPSTWISASILRASSMVLTSDTLLLAEVINFCPPQPGFTDMTNTRSTLSAR